MSRHAKIFVKWWIALAIAYSVAVIGLTIVSGLIQAWSFGMSGYSMPFTQNKLFFPTQLFFGLPNTPPNSLILGHAFASGLFYAAAVAAVITLSVYEKEK